MYNTILVPLDGSKRAEKILHHVEDLAQRYHATVVFLQAELYPTVIGHDSIYPVFEQQAIEQQRQEIETYLAARQGEFGEKGIETRTRIVYGPVVEAIINAAEREGADLEPVYPKCFMVVWQPAFCIEWTDLYCSSGHWTTNESKFCLWNRIGERDMSYVYGPVPSRRLGQSLGVDPIPFKTCNYNCVYCQLGRTTPLTNERKDFFPPKDILTEVRTALETNKSDQIDYVTFVGQGEPLLCASLGWLIRGVRALTDIPVAVITNGSLLFKPEVREAVRVAEVVMPTLDAADEEIFRRINRPWPKLHIAEIIEGMAAFRKIFDGQLWVEVMLVKGINDTEQALSGIAGALSCIRPDQVHINVPIRPPAEEWVEPPDDEGLIRAMAILGEVAPIVTPAEGAFELVENLPVVDAIIEIIRRHPMRETKLVETLTRCAEEPAEVQTMLEMLAANGQARRHVYRGQAFWEYAGGRFAATLKDSRKKQGIL